MSEEERHTTRTATNNKAENGRLKTRESMPGRSKLIISPNLDALLEFEEKKRHGASPDSLQFSPTLSLTTMSQRQLSPQSASPIVGLPPPPRKVRKGVAAKKPVEPLVETRNPWINRAPTLDEVLQGVTGNVTDDMDAKPRRPLISHGQQPSVSSVDSSASSYSPASTAEDHRRVSISSIVYPPSADDHSLSQSLYNMSLHRSSFIEIYSPADPTFNIHDEPLSPINFANSPVSDDSYSSKPPVPTTPKPIFSRPKLKSPRSSPSPPLNRDTHLPPTTNFLDTEERAELIKKTRKLARVFGQTPGAEVMAQQDTGYSSGSSPYLAGRQRRRGAAAFNLSSPRRHSMPLSPDDVSFLSIVSPTFEAPSFISRSDSPPSPLPADIPPAKPRHRQKHKHSKTIQIRSSSPTSFIDISDEETAAVATTPNATTTTKPENPSAAVIQPPGSPSQSILEIMTVNDPVEEERKRKRERLAKLHRFLGSRVPAHLVLGIDDIEASLPLPQLTPPLSSESEGGGNPRRVWLRRRRSSSVVLTPTQWPDNLERVKEELDDKEKALNVRRAQKMEKVFGVAPPLTMYHTRHCPPALPPTKGLPPVPVTTGSLLSTSPPPPSVLAPRNLMTIRPSSNISSKPKSKKNARPGTSESSKQLLPKGTSSGMGYTDNPDFDDHHQYTTTTAQEANANARHSFIYTHYQHSLNSLNDILDRDDRESLAELHQYLNDMDTTTPTADEFSHPSSPPGPITFAPNPHISNNNGNNSNLGHVMDRRASIASTIKSERRRSLPARTSMISIASEFSFMATPNAEVTTFQVRRRRAAKLTQFFGVNYRELVSDVLESIEIGVEHERKRGTLRAEEVEDLRSKLRSLKSKRNGLP